MADYEAVNTDVLQKKLSECLASPDKKSTDAKIQRLKNQLENEVAMEPYRPKFAEK